METEQPLELIRMDSGRARPGYFPVAGVPGLSRGNFQAVEHPAHRPRAFR